METGGALPRRSFLSADSVRICRVHNRYVPGIEIQSPNIVYDTSTVGLGGLAYLRPSQASARSSRWASARLRFAHRWGVGGGGQKFIRFTPIVDTDYPAAYRILGVQIAQDGATCTAPCREDSVFSGVFAISDIALEPDTRTYAAARLAHVGDAIKSPQFQTTRPWYTQALGRLGISLDSLRRRPSPLASGASIQRSRARRPKAPTICTPDVFAQLAGYDILASSIVRGLSRPPGVSLSGRAARRAEAPAMNTPYIRILRRLAILLDAEGARGAHSPPN